jgi:hypothetical protein
LGGGIAMMSQNTRNECVVKDQGRNMMMKLDVYGVVEWCFAVLAVAKLDLAKWVARFDRPFTSLRRPKNVTSLNFAGLRMRDKLWPRARL